MTAPRDRVRTAEGGPRDLTMAEREVLRRMANGQTNGQIARAQGCSLETVKCHARRIFRKLDVLDRAHAVAVGIARGLIVLPPGSRPQIAAQPSQAAS